jgi:hypothetical protein
VMFFMKVTEQTPRLAKKNAVAHFILIATRRSYYLMRGDNAPAAITLWKYSAPICNNVKKSCSEQCHSCEHIWCDTCWWDRVGRQYDCGVMR